jgi:hypothetical protein
MAETPPCPEFVVNDQTINFGFKTPVVPASPVEESLTDLWRRVLWAAENSPTCPCHGIVSGRLNPDAIETNMLSPLRTRWRDEGKRELSDFIEKRLRKSPFAGSRQPFDAWLKGISDAKIDDASRKLLSDELSATMKYYAEAQPEFVCE